eukprot:CAMPEP_0202696238 /NCGR_PEP_ID=MMETSP1385-20130828/9531_1 /ASSEMBLY_ACC=CAM_ASM_000861 /TAXON_ID=933848 /ORGANISM="Elphidium margaritaceum" /LENGTH=235 /DNA_ID=CAMNT_0049352355 /DNA_START=1 /DNA_END=708 /DNA_ORIENTATION=+
MCDSDNDEDDDDDILNRQASLYPHTTTIHDMEYRWRFSSTNEHGSTKKQRLVSIVHLDPENRDVIRPLCGIPFLLNVYAAANVNLFTIQQHFLSSVGHVIMNDLWFESVQNNAVDQDHRRQKLDTDTMRQYFNIITRRSFIEYTDFDADKSLRLNDIGSDNVLCLKFEAGQIHYFKKAFTHSLSYCGRHISLPPTSMQWKPNKDYTHKKMIRYLRIKQSMKLNAKPMDDNDNDAQ